MARGTNKVGKVMGEFKNRSLRSGSGSKVKNRKQAIAIALSEQRKHGNRKGRKKS